MPDIKLVYKLIIIFSFPLLFTIYYSLIKVPMWLYSYPYTLYSSAVLAFRYLLAWSGIAATWMIISSIRSTYYFKAVIIYWLIHIRYLCYSSHDFEIRDWRRIYKGVNGYSVCDCNFFDNFMAYQKI